MADFATDHPTDTPDPPEPDRDRPEIAQQIEDALRQGSKQIRFDAIEKRFRGKRVWVLDREKMQAGVMRVVDQAIYKSQQEAEGVLKTRQRVATAIAKLFGNKRNLTSPVDPHQIPTPPIAHTQAADPSDGPHALDQQIARLSNLINRAERVLDSALSSTGHGRSFGTQQTRRSAFVDRRPQHDEVLIRVFNENLDLIRGISTDPPSS